MLIAPIDIEAFWLVTVMFIDLLWWIRR